MEQKELKNVIAEKIGLLVDVMTRRKLKPFEGASESKEKIDRVLMYRALAFEMIYFLKTTFDMMSGDYCFQMTSEFMSDVDSFEEMRYDSI